MSSIIEDIPDPIEPTQRDIQAAMSFKQRLDRALSSIDEHPIRMGMLTDNGNIEDIAIPEIAVRLLAKIISRLAQGDSFTVLPLSHELTTREAAEILHVSDGFLIDQIEANAIPSRKTNNDYRLLLKDVLDYRQSMRLKRLKSLEEMIAIDQEVGIY